MGSSAQVSLLQPRTPSPALVTPVPLSEVAAGDLQLGSLFAALSKDAPWLARWYATPCTDPDTVRYRQEIARELARDEVGTVFATFARRVQQVRQRLDAVKRVPHAYVAESWFLANAQRYLQATTSLLESLEQLDLGARGLLECRTELRAIVQGERFQALAAAAATAQEAIEGVSYTVRVQTGRVTIDHDHGESDLTGAVAATFARFRTDPPRDVEHPPVEPGIDQVSARILELVARQHPAAFAALVDLHAHYQPLLDPTVDSLARETPFYLGYLDRLQRLRAAGLPLCEPELVGPATACHAEASYDLAVGARGVFVTFVDELSSVGRATVSMVATVAEDDPTVRTFRVVRRPPDGLAHAVALADRYSLSYQALRERLGP